MKTWKSIIFGCILLLSVSGVIVAEEAVDYYVYFEDFEDMPVGEPPVGWIYETIENRALSVVSDEQAYSGVRSLKIFRNEADHRSQFGGPEFKPQDKGILEVSFKAMITDASGRSGYFHIGNSGPVLIWSNEMLRAYAKETPDDESSRYFDLAIFPTGEWLDVKVVVYIENQNYDVYLNDFKVTNQPLYYSRMAVRAIDRIQFRFQGPSGAAMIGPWFVDDLKIVNKAYPAIQN